MLTTETFIKSARHAGNVTRYHTVTTLRRQDVAAHSFHCLRIYLQIWGNVPGRIAKALVTHDLGEIGPGDIPYTGKKAWPHLAQASKAAENLTREDMGFYRHVDELSPEDVVRIRLCDMIEGLEFTLEEIALGNGLIRWVHANYAEAVKLSFDMLGLEDQRLVVGYLVRIFESLGIEDGVVYADLVLKDREEPKQEAAE